MVKTSPLEKRDSLVAAVDAKFIEHRDIVSNARASFALQITPQGSRASALQLTGASV